MPLRHQAFLGDVTALHHIDLGDQQQPFHVLLAGIQPDCGANLDLLTIKRLLVSDVTMQAFGSQLHTYSLTSNGELAVWTVFVDGTRIRGIAGIRQPTGAVLLVHGARSAKVLSFLPLLC